MSDRGDYARHARQILAAVQPGGFCAIAVPPDKPLRQKAYQAINSVAAQMFGAGNYHMRSRADPVRVVVTRASGNKLAPDLYAERDAAQQALIDWMSP